MLESNWYPTFKEKDKSKHKPLFSFGDFQFSCVPQAAPGGQAPSPTPREMEEEETLAST
jgi:hypothetical protein